MLNVMTTTSGIDGAQEHYGMGVDVGGSGIKGAIVNLKTGEFVGDRIKIATPQPATPEAVASTVAELSLIHI